MTLRRVLDPHDHKPTQTITSGNVRNIEKRRTYLRQVHREVAGEGDSVNPLFLTGSVGAALWKRELMFARVALVNRGAGLITHWGTIEKERMVAPRNIAWEAQQAALLSAKFEENFLITRTAEAQVALTDGLWNFGTVDPLGSLDEVTEQEALYFYRRVGGMNPAHEHISIQTRTTTLTAGTVSAVGTWPPTGGVPPYTYKLFGSPPSWATIASQTGTTTLRPPADFEFPEGEDTAEVVIWIEVKDANGTLARTTLTVTVEKPSEGGDA